MHALITGGAGFIGSHLAETLLRQPSNRVTVVDDLSTGRLENLQALRGDPRFAFVRDSVRNRDTMHLLISQCDVVFHLAAAVGVRLIVDRPVHTIETNIHGCEVVLELANKFGKKVLIISSSEVYGKSENVPFDEDDDMLLGSTRFSRWSYACSKAIDEFLALAYHQQYALPVVVVRLFNTIGPRQSGQYGMVVPRFVEAELKNQPLTIYGDGKQTRCFCDVRDVVEALARLIECDAAMGGVFNLGSDEEITIEQLAAMIVAKTRSSSRLIYVPYEQAYGRPFDDMTRRRPALGRIKKAIGFRPRFSLADALDGVIAYMREKLPC